jgi:hypothetical protein
MLTGRNFVGQIVMDWDNLTLWVTDLEDLNALLWQVSEINEFDWDLPAQILDTETVRHLTLPALDEMVQAHRSTLGRDEAARVAALQQSGQAALDRATAGWRPRNGNEGGYAPYVPAALKVSTPLHATDDSDNDAEPLVEREAPAVLRMIAVFIEDALRYDYDIEAPHVDISYVDDQTMALQLWFDPPEDEKKNQNSINNAARFFEHVSEALTHLAKERDSLSDRDEAALRAQRAASLDVDYGAITAGSFEGILEMLETVSEINCLHWDKDPTFFVNIDLPPDDLPDHAVEAAIAAMDEDPRLLGGLSSAKPYMSRDAFLRDVLRLAVYNKDPQVPQRPVYTLVELRHALDSYRLMTQTELDRVHYKMGLYLN